MPRAEVVVAPKPRAAEVVVEEKNAKAAIWERRLVNPGQEASAPIELREKGWTLRWINTTMPGRFHQAVNQQGYEAVRQEELQESISLHGFTDMGDGLVRRGDKGIEVLMKIPSGIFKRIQDRKAEIVRLGLKKSKQALAESAAKRFGANAGDFVSGAANAAGEGVGGLKGNIIDSLESVNASEQ